MRDAAEKMVNFLCGAGPNDDGLYFDEAAQRAKGAFWWRAPLRQIERLHATRIEELERELAKANNEFGSETADWPDLWRRIADLKELSNSRWRENGRLRHIVDLLEDGFRCRSCGQVFIGHDGHDDCPMRHPNWDRLTMEQIAELATAAIQGETP